MSNEVHIYIDPTFRAWNGVNMHTQHLVTLADAYGAHSGRSTATISKWIVGHARLFSRLRDGHGTTVHTYNRAVGWFARNWPADLPWPADVPRPSSLREIA